MKEKKLQRSLVLILLVGTVLGCDLFRPDPRLDRLFSLFIRTTDLPSGWYRDEGGISPREREGEGVISRWVQFRGAPENEFPAVLVLQELIDYPDPDQAARAYAEIVEEEFPVKEWAWPEQIQFKSKADQFRLACLGQLEIYDEVDERFRGSYFCRAVGRYDSIISILHASVFKDQWLTFDDLQRLLEAADTRLAGQP